MSSWSCPNFNLSRDHCERLNKPCVLGRPGCVLPKTLVFATPLDVRIREADEAEQRRMRLEQRRSDQL